MEMSNEADFMFFYEAEASAVSGTQAKVRTNGALSIVFLFSEIEISILRLPR